MIMCVYCFFTSSNALALFFIIIIISLNCSFVSLLQLDCSSNLRYWFKTYSIHANCPYLHKIYIYHPGFFPILESEYQFPSQFMLYLAPCHLGNGETFSQAPGFGKRIYQGPKCSFGIFEQWIHEKWFPRNQWEQFVPSQGIGKELTILGNATRRAVSLRSLPYISPEAM